MKITSNQKILGYICLAKKAGRLSAGVNQVIFQIKKGRVKLVVLSSDTSERTKERILNLQQCFSFPVIQLFTKDELSQAIGGANRTCIAILDKNLASAIQQVYRG